MIAIDPGESIGYAYKTNNPLDIAMLKLVGKETFGGTITGSNRLSELWKLLEWLKPRKIIYEVFALRQSAALKLVGDKFITCEVVGTIKLYAELHSDQCTLTPLIPANKEYCGFSSNPKDPHYEKILMQGNQKITEHTRDAYRLFKYAELFKEDRS